MNITTTIYHTLLTSSFVVTCIYMFSRNLNWKLYASIALMCYNWALLGIAIGIALVLLGVNITLTDAFLWLLLLYLVLSIYYTIESVKLVKALKHNSKK